MKSLTLGTMRLLDVARTNKEWKSHFSQVHEAGVVTLHSSMEYESFPLLTSILSSGQGTSNALSFRHIVKLAEPSFDDDCFDGARFEKKLREYSAALGTSVVHDVQWMWRRDLADDAMRVDRFCKSLDTIGAAANRLKQQGLIERFFCFPYSIAFGQAALEHDAIDGLVVYRNIDETDYDDLINKCDLLSKQCHIIRPFGAGGVFGAPSVSPVDALAFALDKPAIESAIFSSNSLVHIQQLLGALGGQK